MAAQTHMAMAAMTKRMAEISASLAEYSAWSLVLPAHSARHLSQISLTGCQEILCHLQITHPACSTSAGFPEIP